MAIPAKVLPGFAASLWMQSAATPTPLTTANLSVWTAQVATIVGTVANGTGAAGVAVPVEAIPATLLMQHCFRFALMLILVLLIALL